MASLSVINKKLRDKGVQILNKYYWSKQSKPEGLTLLELNQIKAQVKAIEEAVEIANQVDYYGGINELLKLAKKGMEASQKETLTLDF